MNAAKSTDNLSGRAGVGQMDGKPAMGSADMKEFMRNQLMNVKVYEGQGSADNLAGTRKTKGKVSLADLEGSYKMSTITKSGMSPTPQRSKLDMGSPKRDRAYMNRAGSNDNFARVSSPNIKR